MDLVADALFDRLRTEQAGEVNPVLVRPPFKRRFSRAVASEERDSGSRLRFNADRLLNRFVDYPRYLRRLRDEFDIFHITDHSYAHLVHHVAEARAIVTCHDLDAFRAVLEPRVQPSVIHGSTAGPRAKRFSATPLKLLAARELHGLQSAAMVGCASAATRDELLRHNLIAADRAVTILNGVAAVFSPQDDPRADREAAHLLGPINADRIEILHVGSTIARKRIDLLLGTFGAIREYYPGARLVRVGEPFTTNHTKLARELNVEDAVVELPFVTAAVLAAIYRRAVLVLITSEREGFGLPLIEAMACGTPVIASNLPVLREVGGAATEFAAVGDIPAWTSLALRLIRERTEDQARYDARRAAALRHTATFSWSEYARRYLELYRRVAGCVARTCTSA
jgi:glycosyltransferase involved in cell wall biosynthesis